MPKSQPATYAVRDQRRPDNALGWGGPFIWHQGIRHRNRGDRRVSLRLLSLLLACTSCCSLQPSGRRKAVLCQGELAKEAMCTRLLWEYICLDEASEGRLPLQTTYEYAVRSQLLCVRERRVGSRHDSPWRVHHLIWDDEYRQHFFVPGSVSRNLKIRKEEIQLARITAADVAACLARRPSDASLADIERWLVDWWRQTPGHREGAVFFIGPLSPHERGAHVFCLNTGEILMVPARMFRSVAQRPRVRVLGVSVVSAQRTEAPGRGSAYA